MLYLIFTLVGLIQIKLFKMSIVGSKRMLIYDDISDNKVTIYDKGIDPIASLGKKMDFDSIETQGFKQRTGKISIPHVEWFEPLKNEIIISFIV